MVAGSCDSCSGVRNGWHAGMAPRCAKKIDDARGRPHGGRGRAHHGPREGCGGAARRAARRPRDAPGSTFSELWLLPALLSPWALTEEAP